MDAVSGCLENTEQVSNRCSAASHVYLDCTRAHVNISSPGPETGPLDWDLVLVPIKKPILAQEPNISFLTFLFAVSIAYLLDVWAAVQCKNHDQRPEGQLLQQNLNKPHMCVVLIHTCTYSI